MGAALGEGTGLATVGTTGADSLVGKSGGGGDDGDVVRGLAAVETTGAATGCFWMGPIASSGGDDDCTVFIAVGPTSATFFLLGSWVCSPFATGSGR